MTDNFDEIIGMNLNDFEIMAKLKDLNWRITQMDDIYYIVTCDYRPNRINLKVKDDQIISFYRG
jgi:phenylalanyl-tRNA synthetase beta subunit